MKKLMLGNEAIARGVYEAGVTVAAAYPGTPSTEITEFISKYEEVYAEWSPNEKVALEVAIGSSFGGARSVAAMKHVGLNVAADPLFTVAYTGINGGLVIFVADDPGMHSSQNEQDTRIIARASHIPVLEPADSSECRDFVIKGMVMSEAYDTPVIVRLTTRVAHSQSIVELGERLAFSVKDYVKDIPKYVMTPGNAIKRHLAVEARMERLEKDSESLGLYKEENVDSPIGIITSGISYQYVKESNVCANILKLDMVNPIPKAVIKAFAKKVEKLYVVEELEPVIEEQVAAMGITVYGKAFFGKQGEITTRKVKALFELELAKIGEVKQLPVRPPVLCPGCPHRSVYTVLKRLKARVMGDIGCYTLGSMAPHQAMDACVCMGASIGMAHGMEKARGIEDTQKTVAIIGDSTFMHSGVTGLINVAYNQGVSTIIIADNSTTGMTGHQDHAGTGKTLKGDIVAAIDLEKLCEAVGIKHVVTVNAYDMKAVQKTLKEEMARKAPSVVITKAPCKLIVKEKWEPFMIRKEKCTNCGACATLGCPAIQKGEKVTQINHALCAGCGLCESVCTKGAICKEGN